MKTINHYTVYIFSSKGITRKLQTINIVAKNKNKVKEIAYKYANENNIDDNVIIDIVFNNKAFIEA